MQKFAFEVSGRRALERRTQRGGLPGRDERRGGRRPGDAPRNQPVELAVRQGGALLRGLRLEALPDRRRGWASGEGGF